MSAPKPAAQLPRGVWPGYSVRTVESSKDGYNVTIHSVTLLHDGKPAGASAAGEAARRANSYPKLVEALREGIASLEQFVALNRIPENNKGLREMRALLRELGEAE